METKKNKKYDYIRKKPLFFGIGMICSLSIVLTAFEWKTYDGPIIDILKEINYVPDETIIIPNTIIQPPPPPKKAAIIIKEVNEVIEEDLTPVIDTQVSEDETIEVIEPADIIFSEEVVDEAPIDFAEVMPSFEGGMEKFYQLLAKKLNYPKTALRIGVEGKVYVQFIVEKDGSLSNIEVLKGIGSGCDEEAIRVMKTVPNFIPGKQGNRFARVKMVVPISFRLN